MALLAQFLRDEAKVDPQVVAYMTKTMHLESVSDFAHFWTSAEFESGVQKDVVTQVAGFQDASAPASRVQTARLRAAWRAAQDKTPAPIVEKALVDIPPQDSEGGAVPMLSPATDCFEDLGHFPHANGFKWSKCAKLPDGMLLFTPFNHPSILLYDPPSRGWELVGRFEGDCKWSGCAVVPSGKVVFVPQYASTILIFDPRARTWEEVPVNPAWQVPTDPKAKAQPKFSDCLALPDGRVLFVPYYHPSIVLFDPVAKTWEEVGRFEGHAKWNGCKALPDGRIAFVPFTSPSILLFDPRSKTWEMVGSWEGGFKWSGSELLPDGRLLFAPLKHKSVLLFTPADRTWEEVGDFGEKMKWNGCRLLPDGRVVFVPLDSDSVLVFDPRSRTWESRQHGKPRRMSTDAAVLPDGRVLFVPCSCEEIVLFTPPAAASGLEASAAVAGCGAPVVGLGWTSPDITSTTLDGLWAALVFKARNPGRFMDVSDVAVADRPGYLARSMTVTATKKRLYEHIYASERAGEVIYRLVDAQTGRETDDERVIAVKEQPLRLEVFHRHVADGYRMYWQAPVDTVKQMVQELVDYANKADGKGDQVGLGVLSEEIRGVSHDALWRSMLASVREPSRFFPCSGFFVKECPGFVQRTLTTNGETYDENIYEDEPSCEIVYRKLVNGAETDVERVVALRSHPLQIEFHQRNKADGFRVQWDMPKAAPLSAVDAFVREARRMAGAAPTIVGYGVTSDPVRECSYDSLFAAIGLAVKEPWRVMDVDQATCEVRDCDGFIERSMKLSATGERVQERITINEERGEVTYNKCDAGGRPGDVVRVLAIHTPLRMEFYERGAASGLRLDWKAPYGVALETFTKMVQLARKLETSSSDVVGFGMASRPLAGMSQDALWKAVLHAMRDPAECGLKVDRVFVRDLGGYMTRSMRLLGKPGNPTVTDNIRVLEQAQEVTYRPVIDGQEGEEERVFALRRDPLRLELFSRHAKDEMRFDWQAPRSVATELFEKTAAVAQRMGTGGMAGLREKAWLEGSGTAQGGPLSAERVAHLDSDAFRGGLHRPKFHSEGLHMPHTSGGKTYETGFHYLLEMHELGGKSRDGGFGGPLCMDPFSNEIQQLCQVLLQEAQADTTLAFNNFRDPCPSLTLKQVALCKGFDYGDKTLKLPCGPLPWPAGLPEPGYVPKTNPLHGRWITVSGGQAAFIKKAIEAGMLGAAEAHKIIADTDHHQTGGMYLRINQFGDVCTVDASVAKFARAKRTWKSGHYFYEPLVSGGNLLGVWVLPEEYRKIGFFWEMESGRCFRIERRAFQRNGLMIMRQATEIGGKTSFVFYVKVSNDPESQAIPVQSRDFTALAGLDNVPDNLGRPYPCTARDLDFPTKRDTWLDKNEEEMKKQRTVVSSHFAHVCDNGFEVHDNTVGGPLNSAQVEAFGKEHFEGGLHKPKFHEEGLHKPVAAGGKVFETGFHYLLEAHELGGKNEDGGYGGPLCQDPYGEEVQRVTENLLAQAQIDATLAFNNFKEPCPMLSKEQVAMCKGFDYGDKTLKLPCGPLPWPAGLPEPGYVPKTNPLHGRWITVSGGQHAFIKEAIKTGMLGAAEAKKILADTDHEKTGGMYLRINQFGDVCTVDASVAKYARAKRTWKSGHYFYEPLVSGGNLLGVWVLPEEYRKIGFFYEMDSGRCFRIERRAFPVGPYMFLRQSTEVNGKVSFVFYVKVSNDPGSKPIPVQSRDYTALAGVDNAPDNLGKPYPCTGKDLDYPKERDTWLDANKEAMQDQKQKVATAFAKVCEKGFEVGDNAKGGPLNSKQLEKYGENFKNGLHKPTFHEEGLHKPIEAGGKEYESGFHYLLECHELGGKNANGGYGGPLCEDPYGSEVQALVDKVLRESESDRTLCYNNFHDPCPALTKEQVAMCKGFDYGDKTLKLPCGPLPWPAGLPEPGYVPKTNPLHGRWITVSGGQAAFIKEAIKAGMLGSAEANKIAADTDHEQTGGMFLRINQFGDVCTVDASVAKYARAKRTWKSGHYFYEPLVSSGNLLGVWVLPEEYRKIGFFYEMDSGRCFRIERRAFPVGPYTFMRQSTEVNGKISFVLYVKVSNDPESKPIPVQSRDYTALAGCDNVCTNLGKPYPCTARDLDYPNKRDTWLDKNEKEMIRQRGVVATTFHAW